MKSVFGLFLCSVILLGVLPSESFARDFGDLRKRPIYTSVYNACRADPSYFKLDHYNKVYQDSLAISVKVMSLSPAAITTIINTGGASPFLDSFLSDPAIITALNDCLSDAEHMAFIRNLIAVDSAGKLVGLAIGVVTAKAVATVGQRVFTSLATISPILARSARITTVVVSSGLALKRIRKEYEAFRKSELEGVDGSRNGQGAQIEREITARLEGTSREQINKINQMLQDPELTSSQRKDLETELRNWQIVARNF